MGHYVCISSQGKKNMFLATMFKGSRKHFNGKGRDYDENTIIPQLRWDLLWGTRDGADMFWGDSFWGGYFIGQ